MLREEEGAEAAPCCGRRVAAPLRGPRAALAFGLNGKTAAETARQTDRGSRLS